LNKRYGKLKVIHDKMLKLLEEKNEKIYKEIVGAKQFGGSGCVIIDKSGENVVLVKECEFNGGKWGFPKGGKEFVKGVDGEIRLETDKECYKRELEEESGVDLETIDHEVIASKTVRDRTYYKTKLKTNVKMDNIFDDETKGVKWQKISTINADDRDTYNSGVCWCIKDGFLK